MCSYRSWGHHVRPDIFHEYKQTIEQPYNQNKFSNMHDVNNIMHEYLTCYDINTIAHTIQLYYY